MPDTLLVLIGLTLLMAASETTLRSTDGLARRISVSTAIIGLTVVRFVTTLLELVAAVKAAWDLSRHCRERAAGKR